MDTVGTTRSSQTQLAQEFELQVMTGQTMANPSAGAGLMGSLAAWMHAQSSMHLITDIPVYLYVQPRCRGFVISRGERCTFAAKADGFCGHHTGQRQLMHDLEPLLEGSQAAKNRQPVSVKRLQVLCTDELTELCR